MIRKEPTLNDLEQFLAQFADPGPQVRSDITPTMDVSKVKDALGITQPIKVLDAQLGPMVMGRTTPDDPTTVMVDLDNLHTGARLAASDPTVLEDRTVREQLPRGVPYTFENLERSTVAHELSHVAEFTGDVDADSAEYRADLDKNGYTASEAETRARKFGREHYCEVKLS